VSEAPRQKQLWAWASDSDKREEYRGFGTPKRLPIDRPHTDSNGVVAWESVNLKFPNSTQRCGAVGFLPPSGRGGCQVLSFIFRSIFFI
jgi:hypothetical protein